MPDHDPAASASPQSRKRSLRSLLALLGRHQIASIVCTAIDFSTMMVAVQVFHCSPVVGTIAGASLGGLTNFQLGRHWIFAARDGAVTYQAARYALVSAASAGLNAIGEYGGHNLAGLDYRLARAIVAVVVSLLWNLPMQRHFVFPKGSASPKAASETDHAARIGAGA